MFTTTLNLHEGPKYVKWLMKILIIQIIICFSYILLMSVHQLTKRNKGNPNPTDSTAYSFPGSYGF